MREPVKTATLKNGHNQNGHNEWDDYQNGHTTLVKTATLLWSKWPHKLASYQSATLHLVKMATLFLVKTTTGHISSERSRFGYQNGLTAFGQNGHTPFGQITDPKLQLLPIIS